MNDLIDRDELRSRIIQRLSIKNEEYLLPSERTIIAEILEAPAVDAERVIRCRDCKHFLSDYWEVVNGVPLIVAHEICDFWGDGCKTKEEGWCCAAERRQDG